MCLLPLIFSGVGNLPEPEWRLNIYLIKKESFKFFASVSHILKFIYSFPLVCVRHTQPHSLETTEMNDSDDFVVTQEIRDLMTALGNELHGSYSSVTSVKADVQVTLAPFTDREHEGYTPHVDMLTAFRIASEKLWIVRACGYDDDGNIRILFELW